MKNVGLRMKTLREKYEFDSSSSSSYLDVSSKDLLDMEDDNKNITLSILNKLCSLFRCSESYLLCRSDEFDYTKFTPRTTNIETDDLEGIASMNRIYMNMKYLTRKNR